MEVERKCSLFVLDNYPRIRYIPVRPVHEGTRSRGVVTVGPGPVPRMRLAPPCPAEGPGCRAWHRDRSAAARRGGVRRGRSLSQRRLSAQKNRARGAIRLSSLHQSSRAGPPLAPPLDGHTGADLTGPGRSRHAIFERTFPTGHCCAKLPMKSRLEYLLSKIPDCDDALRRLADVHRVPAACRRRPCRSLAS